MIKVQTIKNTCADYYDCNIDDMRRRPTLVRARNMGMYIARQLTDKSQPELADDFGYADHVSVCKSVARTKKALKAGDVKLQDECAELINLVRAAA